jgi:hypothetical protein
MIYTHKNKNSKKKIKIAKKERKVSESLAGSLHRHSSLINVPWSTFFVSQLKPRLPREALTIALSHCAEVIATLHEIGSESLWEWKHSPQGDVGIVFFESQQHRDDGLSQPTVPSWDPCIYSCDPLNVRTCSLWKYDVAWFFNGFSVFSCLLGMKLETS